MHVLSKYFIYLLSFLMVSVGSNAQNLNEPSADEIIRNAQLERKLEPKWSYCIRPLQYSSIDSVFAMKKGVGNIYKLNQYSFLKTGVFSINPIILTQQYNTARPFGWNDGAMIPSRGYQIYASGGVSVKYGILNIDINPEIIWAENKNFDTLSLKLLDQYKYYIYYGLMINSIDYPQRFSNNIIHKLGHGQSSLALNYKSVSINLSNKNIWWGPGINNSLIFSNNAVGFPHVSFNSIKPVKTRIGSFEWQLMSGLLENSGVQPYDPGIYYLNSLVYLPKREIKRYVNGFVATYQPKWIQGLSLGLIRVFDQYYEDAQKNHDYLPVFANIFRSKDKVLDDFLNRDQLASIFFRYIMTKSKAEIYGEYGREDASFNIRDLIQTPAHSAAYIVGAQKIYDLKSTNESIKIQAEITHLQQSVDYSVRDAGPWYLNSQVQHGFTNRGKILGAGIGPGSNCGNISVKWMRPNSWLGLDLMQVERNNDIYNELFTNPNIHRKWVDNVIGLNGNFITGKEKRLLVNWTVSYILSKNYNWLLDQYAPDDPTDVTKYSSNVHFKISTVYRF